MNDPEPVVRLLEVTRRYRGALAAPGFALAATSLDIYPATWTAITGRSGAGKTTLLQLIALLDRPDSGRMWMFGREISDASEAALSKIRRTRLGIVYQDFHFIEHLPVWQNVSCRLLPAGVSARTRRGRAKNVLGQLGLPDSVDRLPKSLSGGERQRVAVARAIIDQPAVLIADEPTSNVDAQTGEMIVSCLKSLQEGGTTIVVATHDRELLELAEHHWVIHNGRLAP